LLTSGILTVDPQRVNVAKLSIRDAVAVVRRTNFNNSINFEVTGKRKKIDQRDFLLLTASLEQNEYIYILLI